MKKPDFASRVSNLPVYGGFTVKGYQTIEHMGATLVERHYAVTPDGRYFQSENTFRIGYPNFGDGEWIEIAKRQFDNDTREYIGEYAGVGISACSLCGSQCSGSCKHDTARGL